MLGKITSTLFNAVQRIPFYNVSAGMHYITAPSVTSGIAGGSWCQMFTRTHIRCHFPRPSERKRIKTHGWKVRMSKPEGKRIIMRRILKGRHVLSH